MSYGALRLYEGLSFQVQRGERVGVIGPNGSGKTTLLRQLAGQLGDAMGLVTLGHKVVPSVYDQHHEGVRADHDILTEIRNMRPDLSLETVRSFMGRFLFAGEDVFKPLTVLSGGELSRVALAKLFLSEANLLLLDEPTNHLDIASREVLEQALSEFPGSIVLVSHDRELIDRLVDKLIVIEGGKAEVYLGNYSDYRWRKAQETAASPKQGAGNGNRDAMRTRRRDHDGRAEKQGRDQRRRIEEIEQCITVLEEKKGQLEVESAQLNPADYSAVQRVKESYDGAQRDLDALYVEWERLVEGVEKVQE
jgi:ATP-binding cassette, subfamily F, member 3